MEKLKNSHQVSIAWRSFELRPKGAPPPPPEYLAKIKAFRPQLYEIARTQYGLEFNTGPFGIDSRPALIGAKFAEAHNVGEAYHQAIFEAYWLNAQSIEDQEVLSKIATDIGLDENQFKTALKDESFETAVLSDIQQAHQYNIYSVPSLIFVNKYLVQGAQPYEVLTKVVEKINTSN